MRLISFQKAVLFSAALAVGTFSATQQSLINRYGFSDEFSDSLNRIMLSERLHFYSLPNSVVLPDKPFVSLLYNNQTIAADLYSVASYEYQRQNHFPNLFVGSMVSYRSPHLRGVFQFDVHTNKTTELMNFADSLEDVRFEQLKTNYDHIAGTGSNKDFNFQVGYLELVCGNISLLSGKYPLRWGPGYKGTLGLSGVTRSPLYYYLLQLDLAATVHASAFLSGFDDAYLFVKDSAANAERFCAGQRLDIRIGEHVQLGMYEMVDFNGTSLLARYANPVQLYYVSNHLGGNVSEQRNNIMGGLDFNLLLGPVRIYGDFLNDDITAFDDNGSPNKFGFQAGGAFYGRNVLQEIGFEYTHVSRWTYGHWAPGLNRYTYFGESRGWPWGNDQDLWNLHCSIVLPQHVSIHTEVDWWIKGEGNLREYHWDIPDSLRPDLDNKGGMVDYTEDNNLVSFQLGATWRPVSWFTGELNWLPRIVYGQCENRVRCCAVFFLPSLYKGKL